MNNNNSNTPSTDKILKTVFTWIGIIICLNAFWPLGLYLIYRQLTKPSVKNSRIYNSIKNGLNNAKEEFYDNAASKKAASAGSSAKKSSAPKRPQATGSLLLLALALVLFFIGLYNILEGFDYYDTFKSILGVFNVAGGFAALGARGFINRRARRLTKYITVMGFDDAKSVDEISEITGISKKLIRKDLNYLAERGYFGDTAYFDIGLDSIVISPEAAEHEREIRYAAENTAQSAKATEYNTYYSILMNMRDMRNSISDPLISQKVDRLIELTEKIFKLIEENPQKEPQIKKFTEYYLPATGKLLRSYSMLEKQGITGKNIVSAKQDIERVLDSLTDGYERQLDKLFGTDALDISSDVDVLETMLRQDGLTDSDFSSSNDDSLQIPFN